MDSVRVRVAVLPLLPTVRMESLPAEPVLALLVKPGTGGLIGGAFLAYGACLASPAVPRCVREEMDFLPL